MQRKLRGILLVFCFLLTVLPVMAADSSLGDLTRAAGGVDPSGIFVWDVAGILTEGQASDLQAKAQELGERYNCGCYIVTLDDFRNYNSVSPYEAAKTIYTQLKLGLGEGKDGEMLMLSMSDRDYAIIAYGSFGNWAFTDYGKEKLDEVYLDNFRKNDWYGGFSDYLAQSEKYLKMASEGTPFDVNNDPDKKSGLRRLIQLVSFIIGAAGSAITCSIFGRQMQTAKEAANANAYTVPGSARITGRRDAFLNRTTVRRHIERSSGNSGGGGGTHVDSGGFSGHSGKF